MTLPLSDLRAPQAMRVVQHIPNFVDMPHQEATVATSTDLLALPWVQGWTIVPGFVRFSVSNEGAHQLLMAELHGGAEWRVVAYVFDAAPLPLPVWTGRRQHGE